MCTVKCKTVFKRSAMALHFNKVLSNVHQPVLAIVKNGQLMILSKGIAKETSLILVLKSEKQKPLPTVQKDTLQMGFLSAQTYYLGRK